MATLLEKTDARGMERGAAARESRRRRGWRNRERRAETAEARRKDSTESMVRCGMMRIHSASCGLGEGEGCEVSRAVIVGREVREGRCGSEGEYGKKKREGGEGGGRRKASIRGRRGRLLQCFEEGWPWTRGALPPHPSWLESCRAKRAQQKAARRRGYEEGGGRVGTMHEKSTPWCSMIVLSPPFEELNSIV